MYPVNYKSAALYELADDPARARKRKRAYQRTNVLPHVEPVLRKASTPRVLEFGPGTGCTLEVIREIDGLDVHYSVIESDVLQLKDLLKADDAVVPIHAATAADLDHLALPHEQFDAIIGIDVWEHLPPDQLIAYTSWCLRHLAPTGILVLQVPNWGCPTTPGAVFASDITHRTPFNELSARQLLILAGAHADQTEILGRRTPGRIGQLRDLLLKPYFGYHRAIQLLTGTPRLKIMAPDLLILTRGSPAG